MLFLNRSLIHEGLLAVSKQEGTTEVEGGKNVLFSRMAEAGAYCFGQK